MADAHILAKDLTKDLAKVDIHHQKDSRIDERHLKLSHYNKPEKEHNILLIASTREHNKIICADTLVDILNVKFRIWNNKD